MEVNLDKLITAVNNCDKVVLNYYQYGIGIQPWVTTWDDMYLTKESDGSVYINNEPLGCYITDNHEIYLEETDDEAIAYFEIREKGRLILELWLY